MPPFPQSDDIAHSKVDSAAPMSSESSRRDDCAGVGPEDSEGLRGRDNSMPQSTEIVVKEVVSRKEMAAFIDLPYRLYKGNPDCVPKLRFDERNTLDRDKNPAFAYCEARYWLALNGKRVVGRIAAIINHAHNVKCNQNYMRFAWIDFEEDIRIARALIQQVEGWAKERGMEAVHGPLGFTDLDFEGMLVNGFDQLGTMATIYNYPYYPQYMEVLGYGKEADWLEFRIEIPQTIPPRIGRVAAVAKARLGLQVVKAKKSKDILPYAPDIFRLINDAYAHLHGAVPLNEKQIEYYTKQYFSFIRPDFVSIVLDRSGKLAAFAITMPSMSAALQKGGGRLFPAGFFHLLRAMKRNPVADLYLVAVRPDLQGKGVNALVISEIFQAYAKAGVRFAESNINLESNNRIMAFWDSFTAVNHKRRRCFIKELS